jgi:RNA polymerase sigma-70 factor (ECF subfamily)
VGLLEQLGQRHDSPGWEAFVRLYQPLLYGWLRRSGLRHQDADDVVQEVLAVVARELPKFEHNQRCGAFRRWLRNILVNRLREFRRSSRNKVQGNSALLDQLAGQLADSHCGTTRLFDIEHDLHLIHRTLDRIKPEFRPKTWTAFRRLLLENADPETVARELGTTVDALYMAKSRVMKRLRQEVGTFLS